MTTGGGDITMDDVDVSGSMSADTRAGNIAMNDVDVSSGGVLAVTSGQGDVTVDQVSSDGTLQITAENGSLLMKDEESILNIGEHSTLTEGNTWVDINGDIGSQELPFKVNIQLDENGEAQPFIIKNAANIYLVQETGAKASDDTLPTYGRDKNGTIADHDEAISSMEDDDENVNVTMPAQTPEEIAAQLSNGTLTEEQLLALISGILKGPEIKALLGIDDTAVEALVAALETMETTQLAELVTSLQLGVSEPESKLDLNVLDGDDPEAIKNLASQLELPGDADKDAILTKLRNILGLEDTAGIEEIKAAYESYYEGVLSQYRTDVINSYRASIDDKLNKESGLSDEEIRYLFDLRLSDIEAAITVLLAAAIEAQQPVVDGFDSEGNPVYEQAKDEEGNPLFIEGTDENGNPILIPVYVMESRIEDDKLFAAYWQSLTEEQKQALIEAAWALADYPEPVDNSDQYRILILNIGKSTGKSNISNLGDITVTQQTGTFTAEEVFSRYGDVSITSQDIAGVDGKTNVTGENISLDAAGSITGLNVEERSWDLTTIANITDEDKKDQPYGETGDKSWLLVRNAESGEIEMQFAIDYTSVRDLNEHDATSITASAGGDIEINEITGDMGVNVIEAGGKVTLTAPGSIYDVRAEDETRENITAGNGASLTAGRTVGTNQGYIDTDIDGTAKVTAGGDININDSGTLTLVADSSSGQVNVNAAADLNLSNTSGNLVIGFVTAGGEAAIVSAAGITAGDKLDHDVHVKAKSIDLTALNGSIGTAEEPIDIDTDAESRGTLSARATHGAINISERNGDLIIATVEADGDGTVNISAAGGIEVGRLTSTGGGDVTLTAGSGSITETDASDYMAAATEAIIKASQARSAADLAAAQVIILQNYVSYILPELLGRPAAEQALAAAEANLAEAEKKLADIKEMIAQADSEFNTIQNEKILADQAWVDAKAALAQAQADVAGMTDPEQIAAQLQLIAQLEDAVYEAQLAVDEIQKKLDAKNAELADLRSQESQMETVTIPQLTQIRDDAGEALKKIDDDLADAQTNLVGIKEAERDRLEAEAQVLEAAAAAMLAEAEANATTGITTEGNLNINLLNGGTVGEEDNSLGVTATGTVTITTGTGTSIYGLYLESGGDLYLAPVTVDNEVVIDSTGDIKGITGHTGPIITAVNVELSSLGGDIGAASVPLLVYVDRLTAVGEEVYIKNLKGLTIDTVVGGTVGIEASGDITAGTAAGGGNGNNIIADQLNLKAGGGIGSADNRLNVDADQITAGSKDLYLNSNSGKLQIDDIKVPGRTDIEAAGSVVDTGKGNIQTGNLNIKAYGDVGQAEDSLDVNVPGTDTVTATSQFGSVNLKNWYKRHDGGGLGGGGGGGPIPREVTITDPKTGVTVSGTGIPADAKLIVTETTEHQEALCPACEFVREVVKSGKAIVNYDISLTRAFEGTVTVSIPVGMQYEGRTLTVLTCQDGRISSFNVTVEAGRVKFVTGELTAYAILDDSYQIIAYHGQYTLFGGRLVPLAEGTFQDVKPIHWYFGAVAYMHAMKIMAGVAENLFDPHGTATRSMLAAMLYRLEGSPKVFGSSSFADVEAGAWYADAVIWAESQGIIKGYGNNLFGINDPITREQLAAILYRYSMSKGRDVRASGDLSKFVDADQISAYAIEAMEWAVGLGLIQGKDNNRIDPAAPATRAEIAAIIQRYMEIYFRVLLVDDDLVA
jgi:uncharacterized coiled-coil protein SlyX